ncbi:MAG: hypothetical protein ABH845_03475, partial [Candidatus Omnitrophota bacterium]
MGSPFTRFAFHKFSILVIVFLLLLFLSFSLFVNRWISLNEPLIRASFKEMFQVPVTAGRIYYNLFQGLVIENVLVEEGMDPVIPSPVHIPRVRIQPAPMLFPHFGLKLGRVTLENPSFSLHEDFPKLIQLGKLLGVSPEQYRRFGVFYLKMQVSSLGLRDGKIALFLPSEEIPQRLEGVQFFLGRTLFGGKHLNFQGYIAGKPEASFRIRMHIKSPLPESTHIDLFFECREFATAYLKPHLGKQLQLPDETLNASVQVKIR